MAKPAVEKTAKSGKALVKMATDIGQARAKILACGAAAVDVLDVDDPSFELISSISADMCALRERIEGLVEQK